MIALWRAYTGNSPELDRHASARQLQARTVQASEQLVEKTKGLEATQQESIDQLQVVQDQLQTVRRLLSAQQADNKKLFGGNNPAAVVYPREDLELLARFCQEFDSVAICDEVWEHVIFDGREHIPLITIPGMRDRTIKVGSAGKIFSLTGWKVGFVCAAPPLLRVV